MAETEELTIGQWLEEERRAQQFMAGAALISIVYEILTAKPPKREHWWQIWRERP